MFRIKHGGRAAAVVAAAAVITALGGAAAYADTTTYYTQATTYQYATSSNTVSAHNEFSNSPLHYSDARQWLGSDGVNLYAGANADAGVVVPLGRLDSLFNGDGQFVPPSIVGSGLEGYNLYFDTSASDTYLGFPGGSGVYLDQGPSASPPYKGTNKAALGAVNNTNDTASFDSVWSGQNSTVIPGATGTITMEKVKLDFASNPDGDTNPLVWAWIGVGDAGTAKTGYVTSVDGVDLTAAQSLSVTTPGAQTTHVGDAAALQIVASDTDSAITSYSLYGAPSSLSISDTGLITGLVTNTPENIDIAHVVVRDALGNSADVYFSWNVTTALVPDVITDQYVCGYGHPRAHFLLTVTGSYNVHVTLQETLWGGQIISDGSPTLTPGTHPETANNGVALRVFYQANGSSGPVIFKFARIPAHPRAC